MVVQMKSDDENFFQEDLAGGSQFSIVDFVDAICNQGIKFARACTMMCIGHWWGCVVVPRFLSYLDGEIAESVLSRIVGDRTVSYKIMS